MKKLMKKLVTTGFAILAVWGLAGCQGASTNAVVNSASTVASAAAKNEATTVAATAGVDERLALVGSLFTGAEQYENFNRLKTIFPHQTIRASSEPFEFPSGKPMTLPVSYSFGGKTLAGSDLLEETRTSALVVIQNGEILHQGYWLTGGPDVNWMSMSVAKSFISALIGIAIEDGLIESVETPITTYVPELKGSAYDGVRIKDVLQMSSGARWNEDYSDPESDIMRYGRVWAGAGSGSFDTFTATLTREREPGTYNYYNSTDTQALGMLVSRATSMTVSAYAEQELWQPLGMQNDAYWIADKEGVEMAAGGLQVTALDYAKLGQLYLQKGKWNGEQLVPERWVADSLVADGPHLKAEAHPEYPMGYGYQWWLPVREETNASNEEPEFAAIGVYNQFIYIDPARELVIVKLSANPQYGLTNDESSYREFETLEYFRAIGAQFDK